MTQDAQMPTLLVPGAWRWLIQADLQPQAWAGTSGWRVWVRGSMEPVFISTCSEPSHQEKRGESVHSDRMIK